MLISEIQREKTALQKLIARAEADVAEAPEGRLSLSKSHGAVQYRWMDGEGVAHYLTRDDERVGRLAQKSYGIKVIEAAQRDLGLLDKAEKALRGLNPQPEKLLDGKAPIKDSNMAKIKTLSGFRPLQRSKVAGLENERNIFEQLSLERRNLVTPYTLTHDEYAQAWEGSFDAGDFREEGRKLQTEKRLQVRSKSEVIIADKLFRAGIPFVYEPELKIGQWTCRPDFVVLDKQTHVEQIWEHFGLMDDEEYRQQAWRKIAHYAQAGLGIGCGLIATFEEAASPLTTEAVDVIVRNLVKAS